MSMDVLVGFALLVGQMRDAQRVYFNEGQAEEKRRRMAELEVAVDSAVRAIVSWNDAARDSFEG